MGETWPERAATTNLVAESKINSVLIYDLPGAEAMVTYSSASFASPGLSFINETNKIKTKKEIARK